MTLFKTDKIKTFVAGLCVGTFIGFNLAHYAPVPVAPHPPTVQAPMTHTSSAVPSPDEGSTGEIIIVDGDTIRRGERQIRLWGMDAPELHQKCFQGKEVLPCGQTAKAILIETLKAGPLTCQTITVDRYKRQVSRCRAGEQDIAETLVKLGWALDYAEYSKGFYKQQEDEARRQHRGLWALTFDKPADWRHGTRRYK